MTDDDLIRRGDALEAVAGWEIPSTAISALPAVTPAPDAAAIREAALVEAITAEIDARQEYEALPPDRGGSAGPKGRAHAKWLQCRANLIAIITEVQG